MAPTSTPFERRRGRSVEELRRQLDEMKREWERRHEHRLDDGGVQMSEAARSATNPLPRSHADTSIQE